MNAVWHCLINGKKIIKITEEKMGKGNLRNKKCPCGSGKSYKNCHLDIYNQADRINRSLQQLIKYSIHQIAVKMKADYKMAGETYTTQRVKDSRDNIFVYNVNGYSALKVDYKDLPIKDNDRELFPDFDLSTIENTEKIAKLKLEDVKLEILYKKPEVLQSVEVVKEEKTEVENGTQQ
jgi:hypothetical protein